MMKHILETKHEEKNFRCAVIVNDMAAAGVVLPRCMARYDVEVDEALSTLALQLGPAQREELRAECSTAGTAAAARLAAMLAGRRDAASSPRDDGGRHGAADLVDEAGSDDAEHPDCGAI